MNAAPHLRYRRRVSLVGAVFVATVIAVFAIAVMPVGSAGTEPAHDHAAAREAPADRHQAPAGSTDADGGPGRRRPAERGTTAADTTARAGGMPRFVAAGGDQVVVVNGAGETAVYATSGQPIWSSDGPYSALVWPTKGKVTSEFGWRGGRMHKGIDIAAPSGTPITAAAAGDVVFAGWKGGYGIAVDIDHGDGLVTRYAHQSSVAVAKGQEVERGERIGEVGTTGASTGPHLHFEVRSEGDEHNPRNNLIQL